jgi:transposase
MQDTTPVTSSGTGSTVPRLAAGESSALGVGLDVGDRWSQACVMTTADGVLQRVQLASTPAGVKTAFASLPRARVGLEVGGHSLWMAPLLKELGHEVYILNPRRLKGISASHKKNDINDAEFIAHLILFKPEWLWPVQHRGEDARKTLVLLSARDKLVRTRTGLIAHVRGHVKTTGKRLASCGTANFHQFADNLPEEIAPILKSIVELIGRLTEEIDKYDQQLADVFAESPDAGFLDQVPGVGKLTALAFRAIVEDPHRFSNGRCVASFLGLAQAQDDSGDTRKQKGISKAGSSMLRRLLVQCAHVTLKEGARDSDLRRWGMKLAEAGGKRGKKRAVVAVARKLAVLLWTLWRTEATYEPLREAKRRSHAAQPEKAS